MPATVVKLDSGSEQHSALEQAAQLLAQGGLVIFPTETVYGVAASAAHEFAVDRLRRLKGQPAEQSFTVHLGNRHDAKAYVEHPSAVGRRLMEKGWPGPLTLLFAVPYPQQIAAHQRLAPTGREAIFGRGKVGLRCPDHVVASEFLTRAAVPVIASSANRAGRAPPLDAETAASDLGDDVDLILDAGRTRYSKASTIVSINGYGYQVLREGVFDARTIRRLASLHILFICTGNTCRSPMADGICRALLAKRLGCSPDQLADRGVVVASCGSGAIAGYPATPEAIDVLNRRGIDISAHRSRPLTQDPLRSADRIFVMTASHRAAVLDLLPEAEDRVRLLDPDDGDIADPLGGDEQDYISTADRITAGLEQALKDLDL